jgi:hypothetical protein
MLLPSPRVIAFVAFAVVPLLVWACGGSAPLSEDQEAVRNLTERLEQRLGDSLWGEVEAQTWYQGPRTQPDGVRLLRTIEGLDGGAGPQQVRALLDAYPEGMSESTAAALARLVALGPVEEYLLRPWLRDGVSEDEAAVIDLLDRRVLATPRLLGVLDRQEPWFADGLTQDEIKLLRLARVSGSGAFIDFLLTSVAEARFVAWPLDPAVSDGRTGILLWTEGADESWREQTLEMVVDLLPKVRSFAGIFGGDTLVVFLNEAAAICSADALTGRGNPIQPSSEGHIAPGVVTLAPGCVHYHSLAHELTHVVVPSARPTWFAEGAADLASFHITGLVGYSGGAGKLQLERRETDAREPFTRSPYYREAARGTAMMLQLYRLLGPEAMSEVLKAAGQEDRVSGARALELILEQTPPELLDAVKAVFAAWIEGYVP